MSKGGRVSISVKGLTYHRLKAWCEANGKKISAVIEGWAEDRLRTKRSFRQPFLWISERDDGPLSFIVAPDYDTAVKIADDPNVRIVPGFDTAKLTAWHHGLLTSTETADLLGEKSSDGLDSP
jgi:hypothetical protein